VKEPKAMQQQDVDAAMRAHSNLLQVLVGLCIAIVLAVVAGGYALFHEIGQLDRRLSTVQRSTQAGIERVSALSAGNSTGIVALLKAHGGLEQQLARIESAGAAKGDTAASGSTSTLTAEETTVLRTLFSLVRNANASSRYKVGDKIPADQLKPVPDNVVQAIPRLKGTNFLIDQNGALVVTSGADNSVVLIVDAA
jgi:hypothetical protein